MGKKAPQSPPDEVAYTNEMRGAVNAQAKVIPEAVQAERGILTGLQDYTKEYTGSQTQNLLGIYGAMQGQSNQYANQYQNQLLGQFGGGGQLATDYAVQSLGAQGAQNYNMFQQQAGQGLAMGSQLNDQDQQAAQQSARAAMAARGLTGNQAVGQEVLNSYQLGNQRLQQRQQMAMQANQMAQQAQGFGQQAYMNPAMQTSQGVYGMASLYGEAQGSMANMGPQFLQPESQYLANIRSNRISQQNADRSASAQTSSGIVGGVSTVAAAYFI